MSTDRRPREPVQRGRSLAPAPTNQSNNVEIQNDVNERWTAVLDKQTGGTYWWDKSTGALKCLLDSASHILAIFAQSHTIEDLEAILNV